MNLKTFAAAAALSLFSAPLWAHDFSVGDLVIGHPMAFATPPMAMAGGGFLSVTNNGTEDDRLLAVRADFPRVEIHQTVVTDGVGQMLPVEAIDLPAGATVTLQPGGYHVMFIGLNDRPLAVGDEVPATLVFEQAGEVAIVFLVEERPTSMGMGMQHGAHGMAPSN